MKRTIFAGLAVTALLLSGCGGDDDSSDEGDDPTTTAEETTTTEAETTTTEDDVEDDGSTTTEGTEDDSDAASAELTEDGAVLALGDPAVVAYEASNGPIELEIAVTEVEETSWDALTAAGLEVEDTEGFAPVFIRYRATLLSDVDVSGTGVNTEIDGITAEGSTGGTLITIGLDECRNESFRSEAAVGDSIESCKVAMIPEAGTIAGVRWDGELEEGITWEV